MAVEQVDGLLQPARYGRERGRLLGRLCPDVAWVAEDAVEPQAWVRLRGLGQRHERVGGRDPGAAHAHVQIDEHADRHSGRMGRCRHGLDRGGGVEGHTHMCLAGQSCEPLRPRGVYHGIRHEDVRRAPRERGQQRLRLTDLRDGQAPGPGRELLTGDCDALVRFRVRPHRDAAGCRVGGQLVDVPAHSRRVDDQRRRRD